MADNPETRKASATSFDEDSYLRFNPDVRAAVAAGLFASGAEHFARYGKAEGRQTARPANPLRDRVIATSTLDIPRPRPRNWACSIDSVIISPAGGVYFAGWVNDYLETLDSIDLYFGEWAISFSGAGIARTRRPDVEAARDLPARHNYGFWGFVYAARPLPAGPCSIVIRLKSGAEASLLIPAEFLSDLELRSTLLAQIETSSYFGPPAFETAHALTPAIGAQIIAFNKSLAAPAIKAPYAERFGHAKDNYKGTIIVHLADNLDAIFLQQALLAQQPGIQDYEFIFVATNPEKAEALLNEARHSAQIYGLDQTIILLGANAGLSAAKNLAAQYANSDRLLFASPQILPYDQNFIAQHTELIETAPPEQTALFGAPLFYDDGSLMHGGIYFELDTMPRFENGIMTETILLRPEHYGRGAPPGTAVFLRPRPVPAIASAFMSINRLWFEKLGGFSTDYVLGGYEDVDFCLTSLAQGKPAWIQAPKLWHLEAAAKPQAAATINRWLFTKTWGDIVQQDLLGRSPKNPVFT
jgi:GT2 family glycosyltransferase